VKRVVVNLWAGAIIRAVLIIGLLFLTQGCGARWHLDRAIAKDPQILDSVALRLDTIIITEKEAVRDTLILEKVDSIRIVKEGIRIDLRRLYDTIEVEVECPNDTIRITKEVKVPKIVYQEKKLDSKYLYILIISIILYTLLLVKYIK
jgi:hypothetical protein